MARADDSALDSKPAPHPDVQSVGEHDETRGDFLAIRQNQFLPVIAGRIEVTLDQIDSTAAEFRRESR